MKKTVSFSTSDDSIYRTARNCTDVTFLGLMTLFVIGLFILVALCIPRSDIYRIINGYDDCGNVCGRSNSRTIDLPCSGQNMAAKRYLMLTVVNSVTEPLRKCVSDCEANNGYKLFLNRCIKFDPLRRDRATQSYVDEIWQDVVSFRREIFCLCLLAFICSLLTLIVLWCVPHLLIWSLMFGAVVACLTATVWFWIKWHLEEGTKKWLYCAIGSSLASVVVCIFLVAVWKKLTLMVQLLRETGHALSSMMGLICFPVLTIVTMIATLGLGVYVCLLIESTGSATLVGHSVHYMKNTMTSISRWYNILALLWFCHFLFGCQHMVTAGAVTQWYFTREKDQLKHTEGRSFTMLLRYHLGTVALGSFLMAILLLIQWLFKILQLMTRRSGTNKAKCCCVTCCACCIGCLQSLLEPIARNAYIVTALYGEPFCKAGKKVVQIFTGSVGRMFAVECVGTIIFALAKLWIMTVVGFVGLELMPGQQELHQPYVLLAIVLAVGYLITHCLLLMYKITISSLFLCFCVDIEMNDGVNRPYFMSNDLQKFSEGCKPTRQDQPALESANVSQQPVQT